MTLDTVAAAVEQVESGGDPRAVRGCYRGLMQVCTRWARVAPDELWDPATNRREGRRILAYWHGKSHGNWPYTLAAYACGWNGLAGKCGRGYAQRVLRVAKAIEGVCHER